MAKREDFEDHCWRDVIPPEDLATYATYARETRIGRSPALLAVDLYNLVYKGGAKPPHEICSEFPSTCGEYAHAAIEPTLALFAAARGAGLPVFYCAGSHSAKRVQSTQRSHTAFTEHDYDIHEAFAPAPEDHLFRKERASAFFGTPLIAHLVRGGIDSLIVCGQTTSGCVRASVSEAYSYGFHVSIVEECVFDRSEISHKVNLFDLHHKYADVMKLGEVISHLDGMASSR
jgi:nicotinamidase-related amidase